MVAPCSLVVTMGFFGTCLYSEKRLQMICSNENFEGCVATSEVILAICKQENTNTAKKN